jgi:hypothetical protein
MTVERLITRIRRQLDQVPLPNESVETDSEVIGSPSTKFSDNDLMDRINKANRNIASNVKAQHIPRLIKEKNSASAINTDSLRVLPRRVHFSADGGSTFRRAFQRSIDQQRRLESRYSNPGREGSEEYPVFTYEDGEFNLYPDPTSETEYEMKVFVVERPSDVAAKTDTNPLDGRFEKAITDYVTSSCYQTMRRPGLSSFFYSNYQQCIQPMLQQTKYSIMDDMEVDVE